MLLRDANPDAYNRALANATGSNGARGPIQPLVLTALITLASELCVITEEELRRLPGMTALRGRVVEMALTRLARDGWIGPGDAGGVQLTGVLERT